MRPYVQTNPERKIEQDPERRKPCECVAVGVIRLSAYGFDSGDFENANLRWQVSSFHDCHDEPTKLSECARLSSCKHVAPINCILDD